MSHPLRAAAASLAACVVAFASIGGPAFAAEQGRPKAPSTLQGAAYDVLKSFLASPGGAFTKVARVGDADIYRQALTGVTVKIDPTLSSVALYDPKTKTITLSKDPRRIASSERSAVGESVWHELTHAIEDSHGAIGVADSANYAEHNVDYMTLMATACRNALSTLERNARRGAPDKVLQQNWKQFNKLYNQAYGISSVKEFPPDVAALKSWFGFTLDPSAIKALYVSGTALPGKAGRALARAIGKAGTTPTVTTPNSCVTWTGQWDDSSGGITMTQTGSHVVGTYPYHNGRLEGSVSGSVLTGTWTEEDNSGTFSLTMAPDGRSYSGPFVITAGAGAGGSVPNTATRTCA